MKKIILLLLALITVLSLVSCKTKPSDNRVVLRLDGEKIYYDYYKYVFLNSRDSMARYDENYFTDNEERQKALNEQVISLLLKNKAIALLAKEHDIKLSSKEKKNIKEAIKDQRKELGKEDFSVMLDVNYLTEYSLLYSRELEAVWGKLYNYITDEASGVIRASDEDIQNDIEKNFMCYRYVAVINDENDDVKSNKELAEKVKNEADTGNDFASLIEKYGEDESMKGNAKTGYYFTVGEIDELAEKAVSGLGINEISEVCDLNMGYFIFQRLELDGDYINKHFEAMREKYKARLFNEMITERSKGIKLEYEELYNELNVFNIE